MHKGKQLPLSILILAGGRGRRMDGQDKGLVRYDKHPFIEHMVKVARPWSDDLIISCNRNLDTYAGYARTLVQDQAPDFPGPLAGILAGLEQARHPHLLVLPCDTPLLPPDLPWRLHQAHLRQPRGITLLDDGERRQPLHAIIPTALVGDLKVYLAAGERAVMGWYRRHPLQPVDCSDIADRLLNINRPEELTRLKDQLD